MLRNILIVVTDIERSKNFYQQYFGLQVKNDFDGNVVLTEGLVLQEKNGWERLTGTTMVVGNAAELFFEERQFVLFLQKIKGYLADTGQRMEVRDNAWGKKCIRFKDPDGHWIEVAGFQDTGGEAAAYFTTRTLEYYNANASAFASDTAGVDFTRTQEKFLFKLQPGDYILDFGCGSGRDTKYFLEHGMKVDAVDGSKEMCRLASEYTGITVRPLLFQKLDGEAIYDGIWACASILHLPKPELKLVLGKMAGTLKPEGLIYTSFKYGSFEGERNGRYFTDFTEETFDIFLRETEALEIKECWMTKDVRPERKEERWLNVFLKRKGIE